VAAHKQEITEVAKQTSRLLLPSGKNLLPAGSSLASASGSRILEKAPVLRDRPILHGESYSFLFRHSLCVRLSSMRKVMCLYLDDSGTRNPVSWNVLHVVNNNRLFAPSRHENLHRIVVIAVGALVQRALNALPEK
jgi:hypothetical protein